MIGSWSSTPYSARSGAMNRKIRKSFISKSRVFRFIESFNLQDWTRTGAMDWEGAVASASASWSAAVLCRYVNAMRWRKRQRTAALQDLAEHWAGSWESGPIIRSCQEFGPSYTAKMSLNRIFRRLMGVPVLVLLGTGCSGINASKNVSPATFLVPGFMKTDPPRRPADSVQPGTPVAIAQLSPIPTQGH